MTIERVFDKLWKQYSSINEQASKIHSFLKSFDEEVVNDHIALRTFNHPKVNIDVIGQYFIDLGYEAKGTYHFEEKKLAATHFEHPHKDVPLVFISELILEEFSDTLQATVSELLEAIPQGVQEKVDFLWSGINWPMISHTTYENLLKESEYAAWLAAFGYRANHFTVLVNKLKSFDIRSLNDSLLANGWQLNTSGGPIKGSPEVYLEQSSTLAASTLLKFSDKELLIPCCYYEFAQRYEMPDGNLYQGFVSSSADKIFESTNS